MRSRLFIPLFLACFLTAAFWQAVPDRTTAATPAARYLVLIVMDGFRPDYMTLAPMHHLQALMKRGRVYDSAWTGQIEAETPPGHATIATGVYPRKHGVIGFGWRDVRTGNFIFIPTNLGQIEAGALSQTMGQSGVPTISDLIHARTQHDLVMSMSGEKLWASAPLGVGADYVLYGREVPVKPKQNKFRPVALPPNLPPASTGYQKVSSPDSTFDYQDVFAARLAVKLASLRPRALLLNLPAPDIAGHYYGAISQPNEMRSIIRSTDYAIGLVVNEYRRLGLLNQTDFVITADHGMVAGRHRVPIHHIYDAVRKAPVQQLDQALQNSIGSIWLRDPEHAATLAATLAGDRFPGVEGALYKVPDGSGFKFAAEPWTAAHTPPALLKAYVDLANTEASASGADVLLPYAEDTTGLDIGKKFRGMHGGFSWLSQHIPLIIAGPGVHPGHSSFPAQLVDIAPTVERLLGLKIPSGVDGVVLSDALTDPTAAETGAQQTVVSQRSADQKAIKAHSAAQVKAENAHR